MCGIAGAVTADPGAGRRAVEAMCDHMIPRGPDDAGVESFAAGGTAVTIGSRRLSIIDPSPAGHQPMSDPERGTAVVFNGMIYNFRELRTELEAAGERFNSQCDTEVVLRAYGRFGSDCVRRLRGMFAFAVWDAREQQLFLARDRLGIKPLYYARRNGDFVFASAVKTLLAGGLVPPRLSPDGLRSYLAFGAVSEPLTAIDGMEALPAAHSAVLRDGVLTVSRYWSPPDAPGEDSSRPEAVETLRALLEELVEQHLVSDAPLGVFLSGGVDSSILAALAARHAEHLRTISVVFDDAVLSEQRYMDAVARRIGSEHIEVRLQPSHLLDWFDDAFTAMDQPTFDGLNTYVVSRAAAGSGLKVALSGLGADELFDGYDYVRRVRRLEAARRIPAPLAVLAGHAIAAAMRSGRLDKLDSWLAGELEPGRSYELLRRVFLGRELGLLSRGGAALNGLPRPAAVDLGGDLLNQLSALDLTNYTKNVLLRDTDFMSMAHSLEVRVPFLDHVLVEWVLRLPPGVRPERKRLLLDATRDLLPPEVLTRGKQGFVLPLAAWMRGELREEVGEKIDRPPAALAEAIDPAAATEVWQAYRRDGKRWVRPWALYALSHWTESLAGLARDPS